MGAWVLASMLSACVVLIQSHNIPSIADGQTTGPYITGKHSAVPVQDNPETSATNYQPYSLKLSAISSENLQNSKIYNYQDAGGYQEDAKYNGFTSMEADTGEYDNLDITGYNHYKTATSFNLEGPRQLETIKTYSLHKEAQPYDTSTFQKSHKEEHQGKVHYHQHKHVHKHDHKQDHVHKHQQEHKHEHGHKHDHQAKHEHKHDAHHMHSHRSEHKHNHKGQHHHTHQQEHKHSHRAQHNHHHKHQQDHKHVHHQHAHKHSHRQEHKHSHHQEHRHGHQHGHKHQNQHKHQQEHKEGHKHKHEHKGEHKHQHHSSHKHSHHKR